MGKDITTAVREVCPGFPGAEEVPSRGFPNFRIEGNTFALKRMLIALDAVASFNSTTCNLRIQTIPQYVRVLVLLQGVLVDLAQASGDLQWNLVESSPYPP